MPGGSVRRMLVVGALLTGAACADGSAVGAEPRGLRTCPPATLEDLGPAPGPVDATDVLPGGPLADLDLDGVPDAVHVQLAEADGGPGASAVVLSTVDDPLPLVVDGTPATFTEITAHRAGTATHLDATAGSDGPIRRFRVRTTCARAWLGRASQWVLDAPAVGDGALGGLDPTGDLTAAERHRVATALVRSPAGRTALVDDRFHQALHRDAEPAAVAYWVAALSSGEHTATQLTSALFASEEFFAAHGATLPGWITGLYQQGLGHPADPVGAAYWIGQAEQVGRVRATERFFALPAARRAEVAAAYRTVPGMDREADPSGLARGERLLASGGWDALVVELLASDEHYLAAQQSNRYRAA